MSTKELNDKLLKFAGIEFQRHDTIYGNIKMPFNGYFLNGKHIRKTAPDLVHDANAQIKYLYPKLKIINKTNGFKDWTVSLNFGIGKIPCFIGESKTESLALALAVEKYIDSLEQKHGS
jgi:hypothetical protein